MKLKIPTRDESHKKMMKSLKEELDKINKENEEMIEEHILRIIPAASLYEMQFQKAKMKIADAKALNLLWKISLKERATLLEAEKSLFKAFKNFFEKKE